MKMTLNICAKSKPVFTLSQVLQQVSQLNMSDAIAAVTQLGASTSDTIIAVIGRPGGGKSSVCNRLCNAIDHPKDGRVVAEVSQ